MTAWFFRRKYRQFDDMGIVVLPESGINYDIKPNGPNILAAKLLKENLKTVGYFTVGKPVIATIDVELIKVCKP